MTGLISGDIHQSWTSVPVGDVIVRERQRKVNEAHVKDVRKSFESLGGQLQLQPIVLDQNMILIDGAHRLAAAKAEGWTHISALVLDGATDEDRALLEAEANRVRLQLSPVELEEVWSKIYEPAFRARARQNQVSQLKRGAEVPAPVTGNSSNGDERRVVQSVSMPSAAKQATGYSLETLNKVTDIRNFAQSATASEELRSAAQKGLTKLQRPGASVDAVHKSLMKMKEREQTLSMDPSEAQRRLLEKRLDQTLTETTLLAEKLTGALGEDLLAAARQEQVAQESLRGIRVALTHALAAVVSTECELAGNPSERLYQLGAEVTRMLSEQSIKQLGLEKDDD